MVQLDYNFKHVSPTRVYFVTLLEYFLKTRVFVYNCTRISRAVHTCYLRDRHE